MSGFGGELSGTSSTASGTAGPEAAAFDGTYVWVATQFRDSITRLKASDGSVAGTFSVGKRPVALLTQEALSSRIWVPNWGSNSISMTAAN
jgi:hypothetical protein